MKQKPLPAKYYTDPRIFAWETERFYGRRWICVGRVEAMSAGVAFLQPDRREAVSAAASGRTRRFIVISHCSRKRLGVIRHRRYWTLARSRAAVPIPKRLQSAPPAHTSHAAVTPATLAAATHAPETYRAWMKRLRILQRFPRPDWSIVDLWIARELLARDTPATEVEAMLRFGSPNFPRGHGDPEDYLSRTLARGLAPDGKTLQDYFIETNGQVQPFNKMGKNVWVYTTATQPRELAQLGFAGAPSRQHTMVKVVTEEDGVETHHITRISTVNWKDAAGKNRWTQYVSLEGVGRRH